MTAAEFKVLAEGQDARIVAVKIDEMYEEGILSLTLEIGGKEIELWAHGYHTEGWIRCGD